MTVNLCAYYNESARMFRAWEPGDVLRRIKVHSPGPPHGMPVGEPVDADAVSDKALCERVFRTLNRVDSDEGDIAFAGDLGPMRAALADRSMCVGDVVIVTRFDGADSTEAAYTVASFGFAPIPLPSVAQVRDADHQESPAW